MVSQLLDESQGNEISQNESEDLVEDSDDSIPSSTRKNVDGIIPPMDVGELFDKADESIPAPSLRANISAPSSELTNPPPVVTKSGRTVHKRTFMNYDRMVGSSKSILHYGLITKLLAFMIAIPTMILMSNAPVVDCKDDFQLPNYVASVVQPSYPLFQQGSLTTGEI